MDSKTKLFFVISTIVLLLLANYANATTAGFDVRVVDAATDGCSSYRTNDDARHVVVGVIAPNSAGGSRQVLK